MRLCGLDLETTGLDLKKDKILKLGIVIFEPTLKVPFLETEYVLWDNSYPAISPEASAVNGLKIGAIQEFGESPKDVYIELSKIFERHNVQFLVAHNGIAFDFPMLEANVDSFYPEFNTQIKKMKKIDTMLDLPTKGKKLDYMAVDHGFMNPWSHSAIADIKTMIKILSHYSLDNVMARAESKTLKVKAMTSYDEREKPKKAGFLWDADTKSWIKFVKECDLKELDSLDFKINVVGG